MIQNAFNSGEVTPLAHGRPDIGVYVTGCREMTNCRAGIHGGFSSDPGLQHVDFLPDSGAHVVALEFSSDERVMLVLSDLAATIYSTGSEPAIVGNLVTPYRSEELRQVHVAQLNNLIILAHPNHPPQQLSRSRDGFEWREFAFLHAPFLDQDNTDGLEIAAQIETNTAAPDWVAGQNRQPGDRVTFEGVVYVAQTPHDSTDANRPDRDATYRSVEPVGTGARGVILRQAFDRPIWAREIDEPISPIGSRFQLDSTVPYFVDNMVGETLQLSHSKDIEQRRIRELIPRETTVTSRAISVDGDYAVATGGNWTGRLTVEQSEDLGLTWEEIHTFESEANANYNENYSTTSAVLLRVIIDSTGTTANKPFISVTGSDPFTRSLVRIDSVAIDGLSAQATAITRARGGVTSIIQREAFSRHQGYPSAVTFHRQRLFFAGTAPANGRPQAIWASAIDRYDDFERLILADEAIDADASFTLDIVSSSQNRIAYLSSQKELVIGTTTGEWALLGDQQTGALAPGSYQVIPLGHFGSADLQPLDATIGLIFAQRGARSVRHIGALNDLLYSQPELSELSIFGEHLIRKGIVDHAYQKHPQPIYWAVTADGKLVGHTHNIEQRVSAWHRRDLGDQVEFESVAASFSDNEESQVWAVIRHLQSDGSTIRTVERFALLQTEAQEEEDFREFRYLHHFREFVVGEGEAVTLDGFDHLGDRPLLAYLNGGIVGTFSASDVVEAPEAGTMVVGVPFRRRVETLPLVARTQNGTFGYLTQSQIGRAYVLPYKSGTGEVLTQNGRSTRWDFREATAPIDEFPPLASDPVQIDGVGGSSDRATLAFESSDPYPFTVLSVAFSHRPNERL